MHQLPSQMTPPGQAHSPPQPLPPHHNSGQEPIHPVVQAPAKQTGADSGQTLPQAPQLSGSELKSVQAPSPQSTAPGTQSYTHSPETQATDSFAPGAAHAAPQRPQLKTSVGRSAQ